MNSTLEKFVKEHELMVLSEKDQELLSEFGGKVDVSGNNVLASCTTTNSNCAGGNCISGCGTNTQEQKLKP